LRVSANAFDTVARRDAKIAMGLEPWQSWYEQEGDSSDAPAASSREGLQQFGSRR
jgi:hypothetical protein